MLTVLGGLAEFERELIQARTNDGRKRARARGVRFGRPRKLTAHQRQEALARLANGDTQADTAPSYAVDPNRAQCFRDIYILLAVARPYVPDPISRLQKIPE
jgi:DNA invertase Pin-like site-specific DNA recombinase